LAFFRGVLEKEVRWRGPYMVKMWCKRGVMWLLGDLNLRMKNTPRFSTIF
jgi:hypothetical protein